MWLIVVVPTIVEILRAALIHLKATRNSINLFSKGNSHSSSNNNRLTPRSYELSLLSPPSIKPPNSFPLLLRTFSLNHASKVIVWQLTYDLRMRWPPRFNSDWTLLEMIKWQRHRATHHFKIALKECPSCHLRAAIICYRWLGILWMARASLQLVDSRRLDPYLPRDIGRLRWPTGRGSLRYLLQTLWTSFHLTTDSAIRFSQRRSTRRMMKVLAQCSPPNPAY